MNQPARTKTVLTAQKPAPLKESSGYRGDEHGGGVQDRSGPVEMGQQSPRTHDSSGGNFQTDSQDLRQEWRRLITEFLGAFALTFVARAGLVIEAVTAGAGSTDTMRRAAAVVAPASLVMAMIYTSVGFQARTSISRSPWHLPYARTPGPSGAQILGCPARRRGGGRGTAARPAADTRSAACSLVRCALAAICSVVLSRLVPVFIARHTACSVRLWVGLRSASRRGKRFLLSLPRVVRSGSPLLSGNGCGRRCCGRCRAGCVVAVGDADGDGKRQNATNTHGHFRRDFFTGGATGAIGEVGTLPGVGRCGTRTAGPGLVGIGKGVEEGFHVVVARVRPLTFDRQPTIGVVVPVWGPCDLAPVFVGVVDRGLWPYLAGV